MCLIPEKNRLISNYLSILFGVLCFYTCVSGYNVDIGVFVRENIGLFSYIGGVCGYNTKD